MQTRPVGPGALLVEVTDAGEALALAQWARGRVTADEIVPAARTVLFDGCAPSAVSEAVATWVPTSFVPSGDLVEVPVCYDGPDLCSLAEALGLSPGQLVEQHTAIEHVVAFCGFAPGFAYVSGSPWQVPRLATPRARVAPGSVGLAGAWTGLYPSASPGGWQLIGRTSAPLWDPKRAAPALLPPGTRVRFVAVSSVSG